MLDEESWTWDVNDTNCDVRSVAGSGNVTVPFERPVGYGDTDAFDVTGPVEVSVDDAAGQGKCQVQLMALDDGALLDSGTLALNGQPTRLNPGDRTRVYVSGHFCGLRIEGPP